jgi:hypothetical protein
MSDLDDLEIIAEQQRYGYNDPSRNMNRGRKNGFAKSQQRGAAENRSVEKQSTRSSSRRRTLAHLENQR